MLSAPGFSPTLIFQVRALTNDIPGDLSFLAEGIGIALPQRSVQLSDAQVQLLAGRGENKPTAGS